MQTPTIVFDHVNQVMTALSPGPATDKKLAEVAAAASQQVTTASGGRS